MTVAKPILTPLVLWTMAIVSGLVVANNYYNQPLLGLIAEELSVTEEKVSQIAILTQLGYATGLLLIVPLGDMVWRKRLILIDLIFAFLFLILMMIAKEIWLLFVASFFIGVTSVVPQIFVPMVAELSSVEKRASQLGIVVSGLLVGILLSRTLSGFIGDFWGWRTMFGVAAGIVVAAWFAVYFLIPELKPQFKGTYGMLMRSVRQFALREPLLQLASFRGAMGFGALSAVFTTLVFHMEGAPFYASASVVGSFGLVGAIGALAAAFIGRFNQRFSLNRIIYISLFILLSSWVFIYFLGETYIGLVIGILLIDLGLQSLHIMNQTDYFSIQTKATSRLNTVYMVSYFVGGSLGTLLGGQAWKYMGWSGVSIVGLGFTLLALLAQILFSEKVKIKSMHS